MKYFIYCRKSSESEDKQVLSLPAQKSELLKYASDNKLDVVDVYEESASAHVTERKKFNEMLARIEKKEAGGLIVWDESRIARNSFDGGRVIYMIDLGQIVEIRKPGKMYTNTPDDKSWLAMCFMMSKKESDDKGVNVRRGLKEKSQQGMYVGSQQPGYRYDPLAPQGEKDLIPIPGTYELIEKAWRAMLTGKYRVPQILALLNNEWGYRTPLRGKLGGKPMHLSELYVMFHTRFYCGWFEYPTGSGNWHKWRGKVMLTEEEFTRVQMLLGAKYLPKPKHKTFAFTCLIRCVCGSAITAEEKWQTICTICHNKFSSLNREACPKCNTRVENMDNPTILNYIYYHCTRKINPDCKEKSVRLEKLEPQVDEILRHSGISDEFKQWALKYFNELNLF
ncbi:MAG: recombinase family protein [Patescibacteria group bacterium]|nr:recombinase family protein [Patescibacteria group bacterium]MCL5432222.1 recombinase family protein [Patescibacteria group bacterium]